MGDVVNLRRARKGKARVDAQTKAAANRAAFGRTKAEKQADAAEAARRERALGGAKLDLPSDCARRSGKQLHDEKSAGD